MTSPEEFLTTFVPIFDEIWTERIRNEYESELLDYEADFQASVYYHLRNAFGLNPKEFKILSNMQYEPDLRPDIGIEWQTPEKRLLIAMEFKLIWRGSTAKSFRDINHKMMQYHKGGTRLGIFCFTSSSDDPPTVRKNLDEYAKWAIGKVFLLFAEGFVVEPQKESREPWRLRRL
jgi:hypothetical protein